MRKASPPHQRRYRPVRVSIGRERNSLVATHRRGADRKNAVPSKQEEESECDEAAAEENGDGDGDGDGDGGGGGGGGDDGGSDGDGGGGGANYGIAFHMALTFHTRHWNFLQRRVQSRRLSRRPEISRPGVNDMAAKDNDDDNDDNDDNKMKGCKIYEHRMNLRVEEEHHGMSDSQDFEDNPFGKDAKRLPGKSRGSPRVPRQKDLVTSTS
ncbi:hypothetical protein HZH66_000666 [Vespula vulgaris]|uniref:Uncharacterized protein n=1 Tax=Vespula vulgaris TaxID=7454 RepID=A0A834NJZ6_VESVU|nr:hypothetical protein HZH66_000666 [Vespula vulgaris]